jgi:hypothetical protein
LNITFAFKTSLGNQCEFNGLIISANEQSTKNLTSMTITSNKIVYDSITLQPIPGAKHLATLSVHADNYGGSYGSVTIDGIVYSSPTPASVLSCNRISSIQLSVGGYNYKVKIVTNLKYFCNTAITPTTTLEQLKNSIQNFEVNNKTILYVNIVSENDNILQSYVGVRLNESYTPDCLWNYIKLDFAYAYSTGSSKNIYPVSKPVTIINS